MSGDFPLGLELTLLFPAALLKNKNSRLLVNVAPSSTHLTLY
jgi:hypothetical protein